MFTLTPSLFSHFQLYIQTYDTAYPTVKDIARVTIPVERNEFPPVWVPTDQYRVTINETEPVGARIFTVSATDQNIGVCWFPLTHI